MKENVTRFICAPIHLNPIVSDYVRQPYTRDGLGYPTIHKYATHYQRIKPVSAGCV